ncbi:MAG TPA: acyl carrier protein [Polyangiaceae bacterium]|nr:acyl carrier protein [Polyangiaceae bacterium]
MSPIAAPTEDQSTLMREYVMDTKARIRSFIAENFYVAEGAALADDTSLIETGIVDSTGVLEVIAFLEQEFALSIPDRDILPANLDSIARIAAYVARTRAKPLDEPNDAPLAGE